MSNRSKSFRIAPPPSSERREFVETLRSKFEQGALDLAVSPDLIPDALLKELFGTYPRVPKRPVPVTMYSGMPSEGILLCIQPWCFERVCDADAPEPELESRFESDGEGRNDRR